MKYKTKEDFNYKLESINLATNFPQIKMIIKIVINMRVKSLKMI